MLVRQGFEPATSRSADRRSPNWPYKAQKPLFNESATLRYIDRGRHHENSWNTEYGRTRVTVKLTALVRSDLSLTLVLITSVRLNKAKSKYDCTNECNGSSLQMYKWQSNAESGSKRKKAYNVKLPTQYHRRRSAQRLNLCCSRPL